MSKSKKLTKEEELLLQDFGRNVSTKSSLLFYCNAFFVSAVPLWLFWRVHEMDPQDSVILFTVMTLICTWFISFAYKNIKFHLKHKIALKIEHAVTREVNHQLDSKPETKKLTRQEKDERILWKKNNVADMEATTYSIFYNNTLFLFLMLIMSFYALRSFNPGVNYVVSTAASSGLVALLSTSSSATS
ncbi:translocon-associated protein subunit gamma-like [Dendronephthya gigantea]|uniref:translocon-associated protein subunit gamma-like n=1 Tax=Dendronephthya gigantea TaxID=151771 RepID=UPI00106920C2|nr:translocon-associated protein subunit gamma-like [Dendronephthya gigantea]